MKHVLQRMTRSELRGYLLTAFSPGDRDLPNFQRDADDILSTMSDATLREIRDTAQRLADAAGNRIVNPIQGIDVPKIEDMNREMMRNEAIGAIAAAWLPPVGETTPQIASKRIIMREKRNLRSTWPELYNAVAALVGTLH